eukprot:994729-Prymnesium_polylepis.2
MVCEYGTCGEIESGHCALPPWHRTALIYLGPLYRKLARAALAQNVTRQFLIRLYAAACPWSPAAHAWARPAPRRTCETSRETVAA